MTAEELVTFIRDTNQKLPTAKLEEVNFVKYPRQCIDEEIDGLIFNLKRIKGSLRELEKKKIAEETKMF